MLLENVDDASTGGLVAPLGPADRDGLAGDDAGNSVPDRHRVGIHHPGHRLGVCPHVRGWDVLLRPDDRHELGGEAAREPLQLIRRVLRRVDDDAALRAAKRHADDRTLPRHPHRQRLDLVEGDVAVVANAALRRTARSVVDHAIAVEDAKRAIVHLDGEIGLEHGLERGQVLAPVVAETNRVRGGAKLAERALQCLVHAYSWAAPPGSRGSSRTCAAKTSEATRRRAPSCRPRRAAQPARPRRERRE